MSRVKLPTSPETLEVAILDVRRGAEESFEVDFEVASHLIRRSPGFRGLELQRCHENASRYLLLVRWRTLEDHTQGFRGSSGYAEWKRLLHHYYDPFPTVEHYRPVLGVSAPSRP